jgi:uncharacterized protein with von Willebrand factor type A (vWA) domain
VVGLGGIAVLTTRSAGDQFANAAFSALGGDPKEVLDSIAQKVVDQLAVKGGSLDNAQNALVQELAGVAGKKLDGVNTDGLLDDVKGEVVAAGLGKLDGISTDGIISQVTSALIAEAKAEIAKLNLEQLAKDLIKSVDIDKLVEEKLAKVDLNAIISKAVADQLGGGGSGGLSGLLGLLSAGR